MRRVIDTSLASLLVISLVVAVFLGSRPVSPPTPVKATARVLAKGTFYLDIGGSSSLGTQPTGIATDNGHRTLTGYANDLVVLEKRRGVTLNLYHVGCPGETVQSMLDTKTGDHCYTPPSTQLSRAITYLKNHHSQPGVVTIDLGLNNIRPCIAHTTIGLACAAQQTTLVGDDLPIILKDLKDAAGSQVRFVGFEYDDPFLQRYFNGSAGPEFASETLSVMNTFNAALKVVYGAANVAVADLPATFKSDDATLVTLDNVGTMPENVAEICELTWMCQPAPFGPDDHPDNEGYMDIAEAIDANLPAATW
jgi:hypothetical protein